jgi:uncharacterized protein (DUF2235 family)
MFGFSRGAFTAKFLARMVNTVGLLCKGNEMVPFAYRLYQRYLVGEVEDFIVSYPSKSAKDIKAARNPTAGENEPEASLYEDMNEFEEGHQEGEDTVVHGHNYEVARNEIAAFSDTFCRKETSMHCGEMQESNIKVFSLGIWDCVNSVACWRGQRQFRYRFLQSGYLEVHGYVSISTS